MTHGRVNQLRHPAEPSSPWNSFPYIVHRKYFAQNKFPPKMMPNNRLAPTEMRFRTKCSTPQIYLPRTCFRPKKMNALAFLAVQFSPPHSVSTLTKLASSSWKAQRALCTSLAFLPCTISSLFGLEFTTLTVYANIMQAPGHPHWQGMCCVFSRLAEAPVDNPLRFLCYPAEAWGCPSFPHDRGDYLK